MKLNGKKLENCNIEIIVIPRGNGEDIILKAQAVLNISEFESLCPTPMPPTKMMKGGNLIADVEDAGYKRSITAYSSLRMAWMILQSLKINDIEWETVQYNDSSTWSNYEKELRDSGFSEMEIQRIISGVLDANSLSQKRIEEARQRFFTMEQLLKVEPTSLEVVQNSTPNGEPVSA